MVLLDQRRLPYEEVELPCTTADDVAAAIRDLAIPGAPAIGVAAAYGVALAAQRSRATSLDVLRREIDGAAEGGPA